MTEEINNLGKGAVKDAQDPRDFKYESAFGASPVDFSKEFRLPEPPNDNQGSSDACVSYSTSYLHWQYKRKNFSRRDVFSRIALDYGAMLRDGVKALVDGGQQTRDECPDPAKPTPSSMRVRCANPSLGLDDKEANYFLITDGSIDGAARAVRDHKGCIFGVHGTNAGWKDKTNPTPPASHSAPDIWSHALYAMGYHLHGGQKCIIAKSSWCSGSHKEHHIKENYFIKGMTFNGWSIVPKGQEPMTNSLVIKNGAEFGVYDPATSEDGLITLMRNRGMVVPLIPEGQPNAGKLNWDALPITHQLVSNQ